VISAKFNLHQRFFKCDIPLWYKYEGKVSIAHHNNLRMVKTQRKRLYTYNVSLRILLHDDGGSFMCKPKRVS